MTLADIILHEGRDAFDIEGAKIPWNDPDFSKRMLKNHLSQEHDWASRRKDIIAGQLKWIQERLPVTPADILDLGCGPGLYTLPLAAKGHHCVGVDFSPASIGYAREQANRAGLDIEYLLGDIREYAPAREFDCIIMTFGEFNVFSRQSAEFILATCSAMLRPGGIFVLEAHTFEAVRAVGQSAPHWEKNKSGLFSDAPHLLLQKSAWDEAKSTATTWYYLVDAASANVTGYASTMQAYTKEEYVKMLGKAGLGVVETPDNQSWPSGSVFEAKLQVFMCRK